MTSSNLAVTFGPLLLCPSPHLDQDRRLALNFDQQIQLVKYLLDIWPDNRGQLILSLLSSLGVLLYSYFLFLVLIFLIGGLLSTFEYNSIVQCICAELLPARLHIMYGQTSNGRWRLSSSVVVCNTRIYAT